ncbi:uncharacterized protein BXZ73DRAFT_73973 [Epithele typhae]|uniref:uncharacterized protein n=1 Tax=Epithele typhae TaxID=378194 RepID=UPI00200780AF|nr:uncharacterized protein BXZ73DRAFT_73973 [Epithele typhae]KAH9944462.1 hypothetical protein BXZ73DRAFT_73973 [Epithele typhae]
MTPAFADDSLQVLVYAPLARPRIWQRDRDMVASSSLAINYTGPVARADRPDPWRGCKSHISQFPTLCSLQFTLSNSETFGPRDAHVDLGLGLRGRQRRNGGRGADANKPRLILLGSCTPAGASVPDRVGVAAASMPPAFECDIAATALWRTCGGGSQRSIRTGGYVGRGAPTSTVVPDVRSTSGVLLVVPAVARVGRVGVEARAPKSSMTRTDAHGATSWERWARRCEEKQREFWS